MNLKTNANESFNADSEGYERHDVYNTAVTQKMAEYYYDILRLLGEDPDREGLKDTPVRVAKALQFLTQAMTQIRKKYCFRQNLRKTTGKW